jgi:adenylate cyclase
LPFAMLEELREEGYVHYVIAPIRYAGGTVNAFSWATLRPGGFTADEMRVVDDLLPTYAAVIESKALLRFVGNMLSTYVGREPSQLILDGQVRRGDIRTITAALMLVDLRDFTLLSDTLPPRGVIRLLNDYFDCVFPAVRRHGGEIMEIMGDGVLAIFQSDRRDSAAEPCRAALAAAQEALAALAAHNKRGQDDGPVLQAGIALHYGTVSYGNIGSGDRLDFTVIGPDVNLTSRIEQFCRELDRTLIMSETFAERLERPVWEIGHYALRGFARMQRLFELPPEDA